MPWATLSYLLSLNVNSDVFDIKETMALDTSRERNELATLLLSIRGKEASRWKEMLGWNNNSDTRMGGQGRKSWSFHSQVASLLCFPKKCIRNVAKIAPWPLDGENVGLPLSLVMNRKKMMMMIILKLHFLLRGVRIKNFNLWQGSKGMRSRNIVVGMGTLSGDFPALCFTNHYDYHGIRKLSKLSCLLRMRRTTFSAGSVTERTQSSKLHAL